MIVLRMEAVDTGNVTLSFVHIPGTIDHGPLGPDERPPWPAGILATFDLSRFTSRSFACYLATMTFRTGPALQPGDYCFSAILRTPTGSRDYGPFVFRGIQQNGGAPAMQEVNNQYPAILYAPPANSTRVIHGFGTSAARLSGLRISPPAILQDPSCRKDRISRETQFRLPERKKDPYSYEKPFRKT